jgi:hypothetical protein
VRFRELLFQLAPDLYGYLKLAGNYAHAVRAGVLTQQSSDSGFKGGQSLFHDPTFPHQPINAVILFYLVQGNSFLPGLIPAYPKDSEVPAQKQKGREMCGLAAPSNQSKGFYKSNRRNFSVSQLLGESRNTTDRVRQKEGCTTRTAGNTSPCLKAIADSHRRNVETRLIFWLGVIVVIVSASGRFVSALDS